MAWNDDLEAGQDDLIKEDKASAKMRRAGRAVKKARSSQEDIYTDRNAGNPDQLTPAAERKGPPGLTGGDTPVKPPLWTRIRTTFKNLPAIWRASWAEAQRRQDAKLEKKSRSKGK